MCQTEKHLPNGLQLLDINRIHETPGIEREDGEDEENREYTMRREREEKRKGLQEGNIHRRREDGMRW